MFGCIAAGFGNQVLIFLGQRTHPPPQKEDREQHDRDRPQHHHAHLHRCQQHQYDTPDKYQDVAQRDGDRAANHRQDQRGVGRDPAEHLACHDPLIKRGAHADHAFEHRLADIGNNTFAQTGDKIVPQRSSEGEQHRDCQHRAELLANFTTCKPKGIDDLPCRNWQAQRYHRRENKRKSCPDHVGPVRLHEWPQRPERADALAYGPILWPGIPGFSHKLSFVCWAWT